MLKMSVPVGCITVKTVTLRNASDEWLQLQVTDGGHVKVYYGSLGEVQSDDDALLLSFEEVRARLLRKP